MTTKEPLISPRLIALKSEIETGDVAALERFWQEITEQGTPLVEPIKGDEQHFWVTFLWRATEVRNVSVMSFLADPSSFESPMTRLSGTDLWYKTCRARNDVRTTYELSLNDSRIPIAEAEVDDKAFAERIATFRHDPLNPHTYSVPGTETKQSVIELPAAPPQPWVAPHAGVPTGQVQVHHVRSDILNNERCVWVYTPPGYTSNGKSYGLLVLFDGWAFMHKIPTSTILDNLVEEGLIPPLVTIMLDSLDRETRLRELYYCLPFAEFLARELVPWVRQHYHVTSDPSESVVGGSSAGGQAAAFAGLQHSDIFGNVLSLSGGFWWKAGWQNSEDEEEFEWFARRIAVTDRLPLRFYIAVGSLERYDIGGVNTLFANRHLRNVLQAKGYSVHYAEYSGGHDAICWQGALADGLQVLVGKQDESNSLISPKSKEGEL